MATSRNGPSARLVVWLVGAVAAGHFCVGCGKDNPDKDSVACGAFDPPRRVRVARVQDLGTLPFDPVIRGRDGGYSTWFAGRSVWVFGDTMLDRQGEDGSGWRTSTFTTTFDNDASDGLGPFVEPLDSLGVPYTFIPYTDEEQAYNDSQTPPQCEHDCLPTWVIWPADIVVNPLTGDALVFYQKIKDWENYGSSIAVWHHPDEWPTRPELRPATAEPTLLFQDQDIRLSSAAMVHEDWLCAYYCHNECRLGRAPLSNPLDRQAWRFYAGNGVWSSAVEDAVAVADTANILKVHWNAALGSFVAIYHWSVNEVVMRCAGRPEGPWSEPMKLFTAMAPAEGGTIYDALVHPEFSQQDGLVLYISYSRSTGFFLGEMRLVEVELSFL